MFERTFSFWRRLVGKPSPRDDSNAKTSTAMADDRRLWVRYATDLRGQVQRADEKGGERILAKVGDLSLGGANLVVDKRFETGQMLSLELPAQRGETRTVLACVVRVTPQRSGKWSLGCVFSRELDHGDLRAFGARKEPAAESDQRIWVRYACDVRATYRKFGAPPSDARPVQVLNISASGIGLLLEPFLDAGRLLNVDLFDKSGRKACAILTCVVHTTARADGHTAAGCNFIRELTEEELESLL